MLFESVTEKIISCCIDVHRELGPGLLESIYEAALSIELQQKGLAFQTQVDLPVNYKGEFLGLYRMDVVVENAVVLELKSTERHDPIFDAQLLSYMRLGGFKVGLLVNFNSVMVTKGIRGFVL